MVSRIPSVQTDDRNFGQFQSQLSTVLQPVLANAINFGAAVTVSLTSGDNIVNHGLNRNLIGWFVTRVKGPVTIYDTQDSNPTPNKTLTLNASAGVDVTLWVF